MWIVQRGGGASKSFYQLGFDWILSGGLTDKQTEGITIFLMLFKKCRDNNQIFLKFHKLLKSLFHDASGTK